MPKKRSLKPSPWPRTFAKRCVYEAGEDSLIAHLVGLGDDSERVTKAALESVATGAVIG